MFYVAQLHWLQALKVSYSIPRQLYVAPKQKRLATITWKRLWRVYRAPRLVTVHHSHHPSCDSVPIIKLWCSCTLHFFFFFFTVNSFLYVDFLHITHIHINTRDLNSYEWFQPHITIFDGGQDEYRVIPMAEPSVKLIIDNPLSNGALRLAARDGKNLVSYWNTAGIIISGWVGTTFSCWKMLHLHSFIKTCFANKSLKWPFTISEGGGKGGEW